MKLLFENWREYNHLNERVNSLDPDSGKRFVGDLLVEVTESDDLILIPEEEMAAIREWGNLEGEPSFLGSGSRGSAYKFGNKVLKFTNDPTETAGAALLVGKSHPNVYDVLGAGKRVRKNMDNSDRGKKFAAYVIVYEFLDYPTNAMIEAASQLYYKIRGTDGKRFYQWEESNLEKAKHLIEEFERSIRRDPTLINEPVKRYAYLYSKIKGITDSLGWGDEQHKLFETMWMLIGGATGQYLDSPEAVEEYKSKIINDSRLEHFHQLALGLTFLKENGITFDDVKTSNIMDKNGQAAIIDVGYSIIEGKPELPEIEQ